MTKNCVQQIVEKINCCFKKEGSPLRVYKSKDEDRFELQVNWGDWSHEHRFALSLIGEIAPEFDYVKTITEENGSDCYSAEYTFFRASA